SRSRSRAKTAHRSGRLIGDLVTIRRNRFGHTARDFNPHYTCENKAFIADTRVLSRLHRRPECRNCRMDSDAMSGSRPGRKLDTLEIERMAGGGIGKRRCGGAAFETRGNDGRIFATARLLEILLQDAATILARAGEHGANGVRDERLCPEHNLVRQRVKATLVDEADDIFGHTHFMLLKLMRPMNSL